MLKSRPLTALSTDPNDLSALTPKLPFLLGDQPTSQHESQKDNLFGQPQSFSANADYKKPVWREWRRNYFTSLQFRKKWLNDSNNST